MTKILWRIVDAFEQSPRKSDPVQTHPFWSTLNAMIDPVSLAFAGHQPYRGFGATITIAGLQ
jgi:hypothetical protein